jgi:hypothetical protein
LVRFDYVLQENADELYQNLEEGSESKQNDYLRPTIRDNIRRDQTFKFNENLFSTDFDSVNIRAVESNGAFVEVISIADVSRSSLVDLAFGSNAGNRRFELERFKRRIERVRQWIPGDKQGFETTFYWADVYPRPSPLKDSSPSTVELEMTFQDGVEHSFLSDFNVSTGRGIVTLSDEQVMFLGNPKKIFGHSLVINLDGSLRRNRYSTAPPGSLSFLIPDEFALLSTLYGVHFWCKARGKQIDEVEEDIRVASDDLPATNSLDPEENLNLNLTVFDLQADWTKLHARILSEQDGVLERIRSIDIDHDDTRKDTADVDDSEEDSGLLERYIDSLEDEVENVRADVDRVNNVFNSLSEYTSNQLSVVASQERQRAYDESQELQRKVYEFTILVALLTVILTVDAFMSGGLAAFIDRLFSDGIEGVSNQIWQVLPLIILMVFVALLARIKRGKGWWKLS